MHGGVRLVEGARGVARQKRPLAGEPRPNLLRVEAEVRPAPVGRDQLERRRPRVLPLARLLAEPDQLRQEVGLRGDRERGMRVEHQAKERRPGAGDADDEGGRRAVGLAQAGQGRAGAAPKAADLGQGVHRTT
jgi:hypothetical protein